MDLFNIKYVVDSGPFIDLKSYYEDVFVTLWEKFEVLIKAGEIISSIEVYRELQKRDDDAKSLADKYKKIFLKPEIEEQVYVKEILRNHRELIRVKNLSGGSPLADPFIIAQSICKNAILITSETYKPHAHNIPNICEEYKVEYMNLKQFFKKENWKF